MEPRQHFYFEAFEGRRPPAPVPYDSRRELVWKALVVASLASGAIYIVWRWGWSLPTRGLWFAIPLVLAETAAYLGLWLFYYSTWAAGDPPRQPPPVHIGECDPGAGQPERPIAVDVFITTYTEDPELVRLSIRDAQRIRYPSAIRLLVYVLDDGRRAEMANVARQEDALYLTRTSNVGFKAGNLSHAMERTSGDFILICDADTRPFPTILEHTLGYFRDPAVAWVQTPQWFYDLAEGTPLSGWLAARVGRLGLRLGRVVEWLIGPIAVGADPFCSDPRMFFDVIQRRRNRKYASFCCGAASLHRREAVMHAALHTYARAVSRESLRLRHDASWKGWPPLESPSVRTLVRQAAARTVLTPYLFHVSEDVYTSTVLHADPTHRYRSVLHPEVESKMLSPQDLLAWSVQHFKYAAGTLDIALYDSPVSRPGMPWPHRLMYAATIWSYLSVIPSLAFILAPIIYSFTGIAPVRSYSLTFALVIMPFLLLSELAMMAGTWNIPTARERAMRLGMFPLVLRALWTVLRHRPLRFPVTPKERLEGVYPQLVVPQTTIILATIVGWIYSLVRFALGRWPANEEAGLVVNGFWGLYNVASLGRIVAAAWYRPSPGGALPSSPARSPAWMAARGHLLFIVGLLLVTAAVILLDR